MSEEVLTHADLVELARRWLLRRHPIVCTELSNGSGEDPDAIGWQGGVSTLIECKVSASDYHSDKQKYFRKHSNLGCGDYRYFMAPSGLIKNYALIPAGWGLLEVTGKTKIRKTKQPTLFSVVNKSKELIIMASALRRVGQLCPKGVSVKAYYLHTSDRASLSIDIDNLESEIADLSEVNQ